CARSFYYYGSSAYFDYW
nr:immunoglobulin heavy chain junction region [Mus musculus]